MAKKMPKMALAGMLLALFVGTPPGVPAEDGPEFGKDILPLLKVHCLACHTHGQAKAELRLDTVELMLKGGENGPALVRGDSAKSLIYQVVSGKNELAMPPKKNKVEATPLGPAEVALLKRWIDEGAKAARAPLVLNTEAPRWRPLPPGLHPIDAVAITPDGQYAACGRANQIFVYSLPACAALSAQLVDPSLKEGPVADYDLILSLAFSPDGMQLASGGYRAIRLWRRKPAPAALSIDLGGPAAAVAASPDGKTIATGEADGKVQLWDGATGTRGAALAGHKGPVRGLAFSPDGARLASGAEDKTLRIWTLADRSSIEQPMPDVPTALAWTQDGRRIGAGGADGLVRVWTLPASGGAWEKAKELKGHSGPILALAAAGGAKLLSGSQDGSVRVWNCDNGAQDRKMDHGAPVESVAASPDGKRWASAGGALAKLWKSNGELQTTLKGDHRVAETESADELTAAFEKDQVAYFKATIQENEKLLAASAENAKKAAERAQTVTKEAAPKKAASDAAQAEKAGVEKSRADVAEALKKASLTKAAAAKAAPEARKAAKAAQETYAQAKTASKKAAEQQASAEKAVAGAKPELPADEAKKLRDRAAAAKADAEKASQAAQAAEKSAAQAEASAKAAEAQAEKTAKEAADLAAKDKELEAKQKAAEKTIADGADAEQNRSAAVQNSERLVGVHKRAEDALQASKAALESALADQKKADLAVADGKAAVGASEKPIHRIAFSADGKMVATVGPGELIRTWNAESGRSGEEYGPLKGAPGALVLLSGGRVLAASGPRIEVWTRAFDWTLERTLGGGGVSSPIMDRVLALNYSPDGKLLASGGGIPSRAGELKLWNPADGTLVRDIKDAHSDTVFGLAFSRDGRMLASGSADKLIKIFDPSTGDFIRLFEGHTQHVLSVAWKRHGRILMSAGADHVAKVWDLVTGEQLKTIEGFRKEVTAVCYLEAQDEFLMASGDGQLRAAKEDGNRSRGFQAGKEYLESAAASSDGRMIVAGGSDSVLRVFESAKERLLASFDPPEDRSERPASTK